MSVQMKAVHEKNEESGPDVGVVKETEEVEQREDGQIEGRQKAFQIIVELKNEHFLCFVVRVGYNISDK